GRHPQRRGEDAVPRRAVGRGRELMSQELTRQQARKALNKLRNELESAGDVNHLNITAMMDMMTILLVFLLKQFAAEQAAMQLSEGLQLPKSVSPLKPTPSVNVTVSTEAIIVEGEKVVPVHAGAVDPAYKPGGVNGFLIQPVVDVLEKHARRLKKI